MIPQGSENYYARLASARKVATAKGHSTVGDQHVLAAIIIDAAADDFAYQALRFHGLIDPSLGECLSQLSRPLKHNPASNWKPPYSFNLKMAIESAFATALERQMLSVTSAHLLLAIVDANGLAMSCLLTDTNVTPTELTATILLLLRGEDPQSLADRERHEQSVIAFDLHPAECTYILHFLATILDYSGDPGQVEVGALYLALHDEENLQLSVGATKQALAWFEAIRSPLSISHTRIITFFEALAAQLGQFVQAYPSDVAVKASS